MEHLYEKALESAEYIKTHTKKRPKIAVARAMYKKHGYTEIGIVPTVFNGIEDVQLVLLEKYLGK